MELNWIFKKFFIFKKRKQLNYFTDKSFNIVFLLNTIQFLFWWVCSKIFKNIIIIYTNYSNYLNYLENMIFFARPLSYSFKGNSRYWTIFLAHPFVYYAILSHSRLQSRSHLISLPGSVSISVITHIRRLVSTDNIATSVTPNRMFNNIMG